MAISAQSILQRVVTTLVDESSARWTMPELVRYLNDGQREIVIYRPDATSTTTTVALVAGARQTLPATAFKLLDVMRNTSGAKAAVRKIDQKLLEAQLPEWQIGTSSTIIKHYMYDLRDIDVFYVYPPAAVGASLEMLLSVKPTDIAEQATLGAVTGNISVLDLFANALQSYILYRAFAKDAEYAGNGALATAHYTAFQNAVGVEASATASASPKQ
ncbi:hypothetical protein EBU58_04930 [bacterium]|nr:hypothetical protein [bacterium]